jgi:hypothetical protein
MRTIQGMEAGRVRQPHRESIKLLASALNLSGEGHDDFLASAEAGFAPTGGSVHHATPTWPAVPRAAGPGLRTAPSAVDRHSGAGRPPGVDILVCALTTTELDEVDPSEEPQAAINAGLEFVSIPILDRESPIQPPSCRT